MFNWSKKKESADPIPTASAEISAEIVAVITAAIAAMTSGDPVAANGFIVRKISRIHGDKVSWSNAGLMECIDSRKF